MFCHPNEVSFNWNVKGWHWQCLTWIKSSILDCENVKTEAEGGKPGKPLFAYIQWCVLRGATEIFQRLQSEFLRHRTHYVKL